MLPFTASAKLISDIPEQTMQMLFEIVEPLPLFKRLQMYFRIPRQYALGFVQLWDQQWQLRGRECHRVAAVAQVISVA